VGRDLLGVPPVTGPPGRGFRLDSLRAQHQRQVQTRVVSEDAPQADDDARGAAEQDRTVDDRPEFVGQQLGGPSESGHGQSVPRG
jgi:hypothetical protein